MKISPKDFPIDRAQYGHTLKETTLILSDKKEYSPKHKVVTVGFLCDNLLSSNLLNNYFAPGCDYNKNGFYQEYPSDWCNNSPDAFQNIGKQELMPLLNSIHYLMESGFDAMTFTAANNGAYEQDSFMSEWFKNKVLKANEAIVKASIESVTRAHEEERYVVGDVVSELPNGNVYLRFPVYGDNSIYCEGDSPIKGIPASEVSLQSLEVLGGEALQAAKTKLCSDVSLQRAIITTVSADVLGYANSLFKPRTTHYTRYHSLYATPKTLRESQYKREQNLKVTTNDLMRIEFGSIYKELCDGK
jgi:hypothetical protein